MNGPSKQRRTGNPLWLLALLIGILAVVFIRGGLWLISGVGPNLREHWEGFIFHSVFIAAPFGYLALNRISAKTPWIAAVILTATYWGFYLAVPSARPQDANDLGAVLLLLLSPVITTAGALAADRVAHVVVRNDR